MDPNEIYTVPHQACIQAAAAAVVLAKKLEIIFAPKWI